MVQGAERIITDCHTHRKEIPPTDVVIRSVFLQDVIDEDNGPISVGIHPWHTAGASLSELLPQLESLLQHDRLVAVGEIGLDALQGGPIENQIEIFRAQAELAARYDKPVILHIVRTIPQIIRLHRELKPKRPWILHGFNMKLDVARDLLQEGFLLSFGADIMRQAGPASAALAFCQEGQFLLETDTWPGDIRLIYDAAASIRVQLPELFAKEVEQTFRRCFDFGNFSPWNGKTEPSFS